MNKCISIAVTILAVVSIYTSSYSGHAKEFIDVSAETKEKTAIEYLSDEGIFKGQNDSQRFDPEGILNRAEWAVLLTRYRQASPSPDDYGLCFSDLNVQWYAPAVCYAKEQGWVKGYQAGEEAGSYIAANPLLRAEVLVTLQRYFDWPIEEGEYWFSGAMNYAIESGIILPEDRFDQPVNRAEAAELLFRAHAINEFHLNRYDPIVGELLLAQSRPQEEDQNSEDESTIVKPVEVSFRPFADQPKASSVARGATYVPVIRFKLQAQQDLILEELKVRRISVGRTEDIAFARFEANGKIIDERTFSGDNESVVWTNLGLNMKAGEVILGEMNIDFEPDAQANLVYQFQIDPQGLKFSQASIIDGQTIKGEVFSMTSVPARTVRISNPPSDLNKPFVDSERETIARFVITAGEHDLLIKRIRLEDAEDVNSRYFSNFRLTAGSQEIAFLETIDRNVLDFIVDDYYIEAERSRTLTVRADISGARTDDKIRLYMEDSEHLHALDFDFDYGVQVINEFGREEAWCVGSETIECPEEGLRKRCSQEDIEFGIRDCEIDEGEEDVIEECDQRLAPVCGKVGGTEPQTFYNRCLAEQSGATSIIPGPCSESGLVCTADYAPVCGEIPVVCEEPPCELAPYTFSNRCHAEQAGATEISEGVCQE